jgi:hypothetical protein
MLGCTLASVRLLSGATYYANSSTGNDSNNGGNGAPWKTFTTALGKLSSGDTLICTGSWTVTSQYNCATPNITIQGNGNATLDIRPASNTGLLAFSGSGLLFSGFTIIDTVTPSGILSVLIAINGNNSTMANCTIRDFGPQSVDDEVIINVNGSGTTLTNLFFYNIQDRDLFRIFSSFNRFTSCTFSNCTNPNYGPSHSDVFQTWYVGPNVVLSNVIENCYFVNVSQAILQLKGTPDNVNCNPGLEGVWSVRNCIWNNAQSWSVVSTDRIRLYNNLFYKSGLNQDAIITYVCATAGRYFNNVFIDCYIDKGTSPVTGNNAFTSSPWSGTGDFLTTEAACKFVNAAAGNFRLQAGSSLIGKGLNLSTDATMSKMDADGNVRPSTGAWDVGPYQYGAAGPATNPVIQVSPTSLYYGSALTNTSATNSIVVQNAGGGTLAGSVSVSTPFYLVGSGAYSLGSNQSQTISIRYTPTAAGDYSRTATFTGGGGTVASLSGSAWAPLPGLSFASTAGTITSPFTASGGYISQTVDTGVSDGGHAVYGFAVSSAGDYTVSVNVNAPDSSANSFFVNIDAEPQDPAMTWDIPVTSGFTNQLVAWRGSGTPDASEFIPKVFNLTAGVHQLIIVGREPGAQLGQITVAPYQANRPAVPSPPPNLHVVQVR